MQEQTEGSSLIAAGVFCFTSATLVWCCMPIKRLVDVVSTVDNIMNKAQQVNLQLQDIENQEHAALQQTSLGSKQNSSIKN